jgi:hypothetical protein
MFRIEWPSDENGFLLVGVLQTPEMTPFITRKEDLTQEIEPQSLCNNFPGHRPLTHQLTIHELTIPLIRTEPSRL